MSNIREIAREKAAFYREAILKYQCMKKPCLIMFAVYMVGMFAILKSDFNYRDDLRRILSGKQGWGSSYGRYLSDFLLNFALNNPFEVFLLLDNRITKAISAF